METKEELQYQHRLFRHMIASANQVYEPLWFTRKLLKNNGKYIILRKRFLQVKEK
jgi:hypothetical protein